MSSAQEIEERASRFLLGREEPDWCEQDQAELDQWLDESMAHKAAFWRLEHGWRAADRIGAVGAHPMARFGWRERFRDHWWRPVAAAASLLLVLGVAVLQSPWGGSDRSAPAQTANFQTPVGGRKIVSLPDGSMVDLNTDTVVRAEIGQARRQIWLDRGEAFFDVAKDSGHPFIVHAGRRTVTVLGTKFSVRRNGADVTVSVLEGRVRIANAGEEPQFRSATISAGDVAISRGSSTLVAAQAAQRVNDELAWRDGMLTFEQMTLADAAAEFNRYNKVQLVIADPEAAAIRIGGTFQARNVAAFVRLLKDAYGLSVDVEAEQVKVAS